jgi:hypothetical protein
VAEKEDLFKARITSTRRGFQRRIAREGEVIHTNEGGKRAEEERQGTAELGWTD